ncbi:hypothetical protein [Pseudonocardia dioxanivorans]|uniref:hypothetical protein n=1 Tax=Pseudonocardia dioxanivorans TaxID=240495 RepID=UPI000CD003C6|nr:hypothetical protein [Pseudonocardia dioxanivorans]
MRDLAQDTEPVDRVFNDPIGGVTVRPGDWTTTPEAMAVLLRDGAAAWHAWCDEHRPEPADDGPTAEP